ncbi:hypothetical protein BDN72DRAFT_832180 [Pluteus cervinus]|uniref:Uncharacterized protein n=1 Tax=Pluteus cervinus TaxID=181527 RepID=A0ACD3BBV2_9AGAR|nr:hypothetical protein BDN72DRAFT_832180 [Pluteus cervinus]
MSGHKYADLPDIDTAPDIYETEDVFPTTHAEKGESSEDESVLPSRGSRGKNADPSGKEELDSTSLMRTEDASKKFRRAEKRRERARPHYAYPPSPGSPHSPASPSTATRPLPLSHRLRAIQSELNALEAELSDPTNPLLHKEKEEDNVDPGDLIRGLVDVKSRLERIRKGKEGRGRLVGVVLGDDEVPLEDDARKGSKVDQDKGQSQEVVSEVRGIVEMDRRVGDLEKVIGSSTATLDENSPLPPPLLPTITRLNNQITLLTQPRHIDSISRRLKLLVSDLDRASASQHNHRRQASQQNQTSSSTTLQDQLLPLLSRLAPSLPHIPHILTRLRTLATLHTAAADFQGTLEGIEADQQKIRDALRELESAVQTVENSLDENRNLVKGNISGLDGRVDQLITRLDDLNRTSGS